jgi:hypothetical protein
LVFRELDRVVEEVTADGAQASHVFVTNLMTMLNAFSPDVIENVSRKKGEH